MCVCVYTDTYKQLQINSFTQQQYQYQYVSSVGIAMKGEYKYQSSTQGINEFQHIEIVIAVFSFQAT